MRGSEVRGEWLCSPSVDAQHFGRPSSLSPTAMSRHKSSLFIARIYFFLSTFLFFITAAQQQPKHTLNSFHNPPARLFFFDDTQVRIPFVILVRRACLDMVCWSAVRYIPRWHSGGCIRVPGRGQVVGGREGYTIWGSCHGHRTPVRPPICELRLSPLFSSLKI